ncbi:hypothetical protein Pint_22834 [Pistacia integerrima]|uniref:Uncharacterized protein n=1 Tax=Pistacia integerrima TaxID=434235 RepID=A0ACC0YL10_9ROSI|nr:hypothetical protein Pint_22834 [Pistacia integerrima]
MSGVRDLAFFYFFFFFQFKMGACRYPRVYPDCPFTKWVGSGTSKKMSLILRTCTLYYLLGYEPTRGEGLILPSLPTSQTCHIHMSN